MEILKARDKVESFFEALKDPSRDRLIMLDYDGTLAPFVVDRTHAFPYEGIKDLLDAILESERNKLAVITGRNALDIRRLLPLRYPFDIFGGHGSERLLPDGRLIKVSLDREVVEAFSRLKEWAEGMGWGDRVEEKHGALAFHIRGLSPQEASNILDIARHKMVDLAHVSSLEIKDFDGGVELRVPGTNKGGVVNILLREAASNALATYLGDDLTDEDAFEALGDRGVSVLVRQNLRKTAADVWITPPDELKEWLNRFIVLNE